MERTTAGFWWGFGEKQKEDGKTGTFPTLPAAQIGKALGREKGIQKLHNKFSCLIFLYCCAQQFHMKNFVDLLSKTWIYIFLKFWAGRTIDILLYILWLFLPKERFSVCMCVYYTWSLGIFIRPPMWKLLDKERWAEKTEFVLRFTSMISLFFLHDFNTQECTGVVHITSTFQYSIEIHLYVIL